MLKLLARRFIKDYQRKEDPAVRLRYGALAGITGICLNVLLTIFKLIGGALTKSVAVTADALNNLGDAASSLVTLVGFRMAGKKADREHPFGHGRTEYIAGLIVAMLILIMGVELLISSVKKIVQPEPVAFSWLTAGILIAAILVKLYMFLYNRGIGKAIASSAMRATALDSLSDMVATGAVLLSMFLSRWTGLMLDGWAGALVALFILYTGYCAVKETIGPLLGGPPSEALMAQIAQIVLGEPVVVGMHDLMVHDYGPGRVIVTLHAEVPADGDILLMHDAVDNLEKRLQATLGCTAVIHMDPVVTGDAETDRYREIVQRIATDIDPRFTIHDFRYVPGTTHTNLVFDVVIPFGLSMSDEAVKAAICARVRALEGEYYAVVEIDKSYVG